MNRSHRPIPGRPVVGSTPHARLSADGFFNKRRGGDTEPLLLDAGIAIPLPRGPLDSLKWYNRLAYTAHLAQFIAILVVGLNASSSARAPYQLTTSRVLVDSPGAGLELAGGIGGCLNGTHYAHPRLLQFRAGGGDDANVTSLRLTPFVARTGYELSLPWLLASFFLLSFSFQLLAVEPVPGREHLYDDMAMESSPAVNWLRFAEYSVSASVMMLAISLVAGITDARVLACVFFLTWGCMVCGILAEVLLRWSQLKGFEYATQAWALAMGAHLAGWVFVAVPWAIVITQYGYLFSLCELGRDCAAASSSAPGPLAGGGGDGYCGEGGGQRVQPPDFVRAIVWAQFALFSCFGLVQLVQLLRPSRDLRIQAEWAYVTLSLVAKTLLAWLVASNLLFQA